MLATEAESRELIGSELPRLAPPVPARTLLKDFQSTAASLGISPLPWQDTVARYLYALGQHEKWLYPEVASIVSRQQGKTWITKPHIMERLRMGRKILHVAQTRELPRKMFFQLVPLVEARYPDARVRRGGGQESIELSNGGMYTITAATGGGPRGLSIDDLICDELRELTEEFVDAAVPTMSASLNPQTLYLSNAGDEKSAALNAVKARAADDPSLAYLEWSAAPGRPADDIEGWLESNPSIGHFPMLLSNLERLYRSAKLSGNLGAFETEHLCRWVTTMRQDLVDAFSWTRCRDDGLEEARRPSMGLSMSPDGKRASVALAWPRDDGTIGLRMAYNVPGDPIDTDALGEELRQLARRLRIRSIGFDPQTDRELAKYFEKPTSISGSMFANASAQFVNVISALKLRWQDCDAVTDDLTWTSRKEHDGSGHFEAVRSSDEHSITASLAAIRAVWLASGPRPTSPRVR